MVATHQPVLRNSRPSDIIIPHSGAGGLTPSPRNPSDAVVRMIKTTSDVRKMMAGGIALGKMCPRRMRRRE
jgi:microsomal dipeptidase-like Zn-dependent dipeptidase